MKRSELPRSVRLYRKSAKAETGAEGSSIGVSWRSGALRTHGVAGVEVWILSTSRECWVAKEVYSFFHPLPARHGVRLRRPGHGSGNRFPAVVLPLLPLWSNQPGLAEQDIHALCVFPGQEGQMTA